MTEWWFGASWMFMGYSDACGIGGWQSDGGFGGGVWVQKWC